MDDVEMVELSPTDWELYKNFRLDAVEEEPHAWGKTEQEVSSFPDQYWQDHLERAQKGHDLWIYFAKVDNQIIGMVFAERVSRKISNHIALIHSVSVKKEYRGKGIATELMEYLLDKLKQHQILKVQLGVVAGQDEAISLYQKLGFEIVGTRKKVFKYGDKFQDEVLMDKFLD